MINLATGIQGIQQLQAFFKYENIESNAFSDHVVVKSTEKQIREVFELGKFCPLISENKIGGNYIVSMVPYRIPESFFKTSYLTFNEITSLFKSALFLEKNDVKDPWDTINYFRKLVSPALNKGLSEILEKSSKENLPIIEFGSGIGYSLTEMLSERTIRTQISDNECRLLNTYSSKPAYKLDIEGACKGLLENGKKVPLFFALNVFDTLIASERQASFSQISKLQHAGDRMLIMLDVNPFLNRAIESLKSLYPLHAVFPYYPTIGENYSFIIVPLEKAPFDPSVSDFEACMEMEAKAAMNGGTSDLQVGLRNIQGKFNLKVINHEEFFIEQVKGELDGCGYTSNVYYHAAFTVGKAGITQDLVYKPVTDIFSVREWSLKDERLLKALSKKGISIPSEFDENFLRSMRMQGQKIIGAEILVIEATKK